MKLRKRYCFDGNNNPQEAVVYDTFAVSPDGRTFFIKGGRNGGVRLKVHFAYDDKMYIGYNLHQHMLVEVNHCFRDTIELMLKKAVAQRTAEELKPINSVAGFTATDNGIVHHQNGWYTLTDFALEIQSPEWAPGAQAWDIKEGIYIIFPDTSFRLIPRREYFGFLKLFCREPEYRQGDLLVFRGWNPPKKDSIQNCVSIDIDRHTVSIQDGSAILYREAITAEWPNDNSFGVVMVGGAKEETNVLLKHPEHELEKIQLKNEDEGYTFVLVPGTSRPFQRDDGLD
ncbi:MAG: hypothetical protein WC621_05470 [Patescibacteria group bacterium]